MTCVVCACLEANPAPILLKCIQIFRVSDLSVTAMHNYSRTQRDHMSGGWHFIDWHSFSIASLRAM